MLVRPLPFAEADRLVWLYATDPATGGRNQLSGPEAQRLAGLTATFAAVAAFGDRGFVLSTAERPVRWSGIWATPSLFDVLGIRPALGRAFTLDDVRAGTQRIVVIGYERWQQDFRGDPQVIGRVLRLSEHSYTVVGVLPPGLDFPLARSPQSGSGTGFKVGVQDFWIPGQERADDFPGGTVIARLRPSAPLAVARAEVATVARAMAAELPAADRGRTFEMLPIRDQVLGLARPALLLLQGFSVLVLLIACGNVANEVWSSGRSRWRSCCSREGRWCCAVCRGCSPSPSGTTRNGW
jgi:hypothetical protein